MDRDGEVGRVFDRAHDLLPEDMRSDLNRWLLENAQEFAELRQAMGRRKNSWSRLSLALFAETGIGRDVGDERKPVAPETLRSAWYRTRVLLSERGLDWVGFSKTPRARRGQPIRQPPPPKTGASGVRPAAVEAPAASVPVQPEPAGMPDYLTEQLSVGQRHLTKRGV